MIPSGSPKMSAKVPLAVVALTLALAGCSSSPASDDVGASSGGGRGGSAATGGAAGASSGGGGGRAADAGAGGMISGTAGSGGSPEVGGSGGAAGGSAGADGDAAPADDSGTADGGGSVPAGTPIETLQVLASGDSAASKTSLAKGEIFLLRASGAIDLGGTKVDAEFASTDGTTGMDSAGGVDVGLDNGQKDLILLGKGAAAPLPGPNRMKWFGAFRADHVYYMWLTGVGAPVSLKLVKPTGAAAGAGSIDVSIYQLTPMPMGIGKPLETVAVSFLTKAAREPSMLKTAAGTVYLLRANGESQVGGPGNNGDADFDDYGPTSTNANQGEGGADFGICVDEPCSALRKLKWGSYRMDHDYYMLYAGTGMPIVFGYCDTGYPDNKGGMPVDIYAVP